jgi:hypothetical protein
VHHLDGATGEAEAEGPERGLACPGDDLISGRSMIISEIQISGETGFLQDMFYY